jgi:putative restriction endonuclease
MRNPLRSREDEIRAAAFLFLENAVASHGETLPAGVLTRGFEFAGERVPLMFPQRGIFKPRVFDQIPISFLTSPDDPYGDNFDDATGTLTYRYFQTDPLHPDNVGMRLAGERGIPLVYFHGIESGRYLAVWPCYVKRDRRDQLSFEIELEARPSLLAQFAFDREMPVEAEPVIARGYVDRTVRARIHQAKFRARVLAAYRNQCSFCRLRHEELLSAAHITADADPQGHPEVSNGLALCALHHIAFDRFFVTVRPDLSIEVRPDLLREKDGPTLVHAVQSLNGQNLYLPVRRIHHPDPKRLERRYDEYKRFLADRRIA